MPARRPRRPCFCRKQARARLTGWWTLPAREG
uniref:Uncharacterized protein n=1 Tax=Arundo donax TaxID=35708 RepID=A0A0A9BXW3_ARUDO